MNYKSLFTGIILIVLLSFFTSSLTAQRSRAQYPGFMQNSYYGINIGYIDYPFSNEHLVPGYTAETIEIPHTAVRLILYGRQINDYLSVNINYMRPVLWVRYLDIYHDGELVHNRRQVPSMNVGGLTAKAQYPVNNRFTVFGEFGLSVVARRGFKIDDVQVMKPANYASYLLSGGLKYQINEKFDLMFHCAYTPANEKANHPYTIFFAPGFQYNMKPLPEETVKANTATGNFFPKHQLMFEYSTNAMGYGINAFVSEGTIPVFWGGAVEVEKGLSANYQRNIFHTRTTFSLDVGASASYFNTISGTDFFTLAAYPVFRFHLLRTQPADIYFFYILGGPTYISKSQFQEVYEGEAIDTGKRFTFHDYMGIGIYTGQSRNIIAEVKIGHYSNGNIFPQNAGVKIPLTFALGYTF